MSEYFYPDHDSEAFMKEINEWLAPVAKVTQIDGDLCDTFKAEATEPIDNILIKGKTYQDIVRKVAAKHYRAPATFKDNEFWFFALP